MLTLDVDLELDLEVGERRAHATVTSAGGRLVLEVDDPGLFAGSDDAPAIREVAAHLARRGLVLEVLSDGRHLVSLGAVRCPWWQRRVTRSRHIRLGSARGAWTSARARLGDQDPVMPAIALAPPPTLWPLAPTFARRPRRRVTTTHDPAGGGLPRLVEVRSVVRVGRETTHWLEESTTFGSSAECDVVMPGVAPVHARVVRDERDEFVVRAVDGPVRVHGAPVDEAILRTGTRVEMGDYLLVFSREEYADHGRPFGGRIGGELGYQRPQPPREAAAQVAPGPIEDTRAQ